MSNTPVTPKNFVVRYKASVERAFKNAGVKFQGIEDENFEKLMESLSAEANKLLANFQPSWPPPPPQTGEKDEKPRLTFGFFLKSLTKGIEDEEIEAMCEISTPSTIALIKEDCFPNNIPVWYFVRILKHFNLSFESTKFLLQNTFDKAYKNRKPITAFDSQRELWENQEAFDKWLNRLGVLLEQLQPPPAQSDQEAAEKDIVDNLIYTIIEADDNKDPYSLIREKVIKIIKNAYTTLPGQPVDAVAICPKCNGQGFTIKPPWVAGDINEWTDSEGQHVCNLCNGKMVVNPTALFTARHPTPKPEEEKS